MNRALEAVLSLPWAIRDGWLEIIASIAERENEFAFRLGRLNELVQKGLVDPNIGTLPKQAQLLTEHCMRLTPPKTVEQGKTRVRYDLRKIFHPVDKEDMKNPAVRALVYRSDFAAWDAFARNVKGGPFAGTKAVTPMPEMHTANRDRRGRAKKTNFVTLWKQRGEMNRIIRDAQTRVGWARAGWNVAFRALRGVAPAWVAKHANSPGKFVNGLANPQPFIEVANNTKWAGRADSEQIVRKALAYRARDMKTYFDKMMGLAASGTATPYQAQQAQIAAQFTDAA
jgi:hypothetical protein